MKPALRQQGSGVFDLIEEATQLVRTASAATLAVYYAGTIPFVLGLLFFWADMSRSPFAYDHLAEASLSMGLLFLWMKFWQAIFARRIRAQRAARPPQALKFRQVARIFLAQTMLQPFALFLYPQSIIPLLPSVNAYLLPLSVIPVLSFPWVCAFYQSVTALDDGVESRRKLFIKSWRQAALWPRQNILAVLILTSFAFYVFLNWAVVCLSLPGLFKMLFGIDSVYVESPWSMLNSTFFISMFGLTYLCVDPILKTFYTLRCFYGESLESGEDLKAELKQFASAASRVVAVLLIFSATLFSGAVSAAGTVPGGNPPTASQVSSQDLDRAINQTIHERKFTWRMPRDTIEDTNTQGNFLERFFDKAGNMLRKWARAVLHWIDELLNKLFRNWRPSSYESNSSGYGWILAVQLLLWALVAVVASALAIFLYRVWRNRRKSRSAIKSEAITPVPDLADENVRADELPEEGWMKLGRELLVRGELRLAMRAFYLASLSHLAARHLISIARFKSNRDYERELRRRGHSFPELLLIFGENISAFEAIWYGMHDVNFDLVNQFAGNVERIKSTG